MTNDQIAADVGVSRSTLAKWKLRQGFRNEVECIRVAVREQVLSSGYTPLFNVAPGDPKKIPNQLANRRTARKSPVNAANGSSDPKILTVDESNTYKKRPIFNNL